jgi:sphinganine-1-phosphate aldolase
VPQGSVDDIPGLSEIAIAHNLGLHVDCCLGGFLVPFMEKAGFRTKHAFDFRVPGVTTISCDPHKYGFAPKGASVLMFRSAELRHCMYSFATQWSGGIYATPSILGSRPGGVVAATWAAMMKHGESGYIETTRQIVGATRQIGQAVAKLDGLKLVGRPEVCVVAFVGAPNSGVNCYSLCDALKQTGDWELATLQNPPAVHLALTLPSSRNAKAFVADLEAALQLLRSDPAKWSGGTAGLYGTLSKLPSAFIEESAKVFLDTMTVCALSGATTGESRTQAGSNTKV